MRLQRVSTTYQLCAWTPRGKPRIGADANSDCATQKSWQSELKNCTWTFTNLQCAQPTKFAAMHS
jgi:hypothetical protein